MKSAIREPSVGCVSVLVVLAGLCGAAVAEPQPSDVRIVVDPGVRSIQKCATQVLAFRTPSDGWLASGCGDLFRSRDGGHHWVALDAVVPPLSLVPTSGLLGRELHGIEWLDERTGLIVGPRGFVVRSADGGQSWQRRELPGSDSVYRTEHVGPTVWVCDSRSNLFRSDDAGDTWRRIALLPAPAGCYGLSFADRDHGWVAASMAAQLWQTSDGGATWTVVPTPSNLQNLTPLRITQDLGWIYTDLATPADISTVAYRTNDGGQHWTQATFPSQPATANLSRLRIGDRQRELTAADSIRSVADLDRITPVPPRENLQRLDEHTTVRIERGSITWYRDGQRAGQSRVLSPPSGTSERLAGVVSMSSGKGRWGWTEQHVYRNEDDGAGWFVVSDTPERFERMILLNDVTALARARSGKLYRSFGWFKDWRETTDPMDRWEWSRRFPESGPVVSPVACLSTAKQGVVSLSVVEQGCFHHRAHKLEARWSNEGADLRVEPAQAPRRPPRG